MEFKHGVHTVIVPANPDIYIAAWNASVGTR